MNRPVETFELECSGCGRTIEIRAPVNARGLICPLCGELLEIDWRPGPDTDEPREEIE